jgi:hypothetical protein
MEDNQTPDNHTNPEPAEGSVHNQGLSPAPSHETHAWQEQSQQPLPPLETAPQPAATPEPAPMPASDPVPPAPAASIYPSPPSFGGQPLQPVAAMPQPAPAAAPTGVAPHAPVSAGLIVLQWLTYAFWGWTIMGVSILVSTILANFISQAETGGFMPYGIAAVLVLLPISIVCEVFYSRHEPAKKVGPASLVMIVHAVLFALFGISALIGVVISLVSLFVSSSDSSTIQVALFSCIIITVLYAAVFLRTIHPARMPWINRAFLMFVTITVGVISLLGIFGPMANARLTRNDRLIESNLSSVQSSISSYVRTNKKLPENLGTLKLKNDALKLVEDDLITYKANTKAPSSDSTYYGSNYNNDSTTKTYYYELCATFKKEKTSRYDDYNSEDKDGYVTYLSAYYHDAGETCYKIKTDYYSY